MKKILTTLMLSLPLTSNVHAACINNANGSITCNADSGDIVFTNSNDITPTAPATSITLNSSTGITELTNNGNIDNRFGGGIISASNTGTLKIVSNGSINVNNASSISTGYNSNLTNVEYVVSGDITQTLIGANNSHNILVANTVNPASKAKVTISDGVKITTIGRDVSNNVMYHGGTGISLTSMESASLIIGKNVIIDTRDGGGGAAQVSVFGDSYTEIGAGSILYGAARSNGAGEAILYSTKNNGIAKIVNHGNIDSLTGRALFRSFNSGDGTGTGKIYNESDGVINGLISSTVNTGLNLEVNLYNYGIWNAIFYQDKQVLDGTRDTLYVAENIYGNGEIKNYGRINIINPDFYDTAPTTINTTGQYLVDNLAVHNMNNGAMQVSMINLSTFSNYGIIDMQYNKYAGDVLTLTNTATEVTGAPTTAGTTGGTGNYVSQGGSLLIDTVLNEGGAASASDILVVDNTTLGAGGATSIFVNNLGGKGKLTINDGIKVVEVLGATSDANSFILGTPLTVGLYEYSLYQGDIAGTDTLSWYLRNSPTNINPKVGNNLRSQSIMNSLFMHDLYDRIGRVNSIDNCASAYDKHGMWARIDARKSESNIASNIEGKSNIYLTHLGSDILRKDIGKADLHIGIMGGYAKVNTDSKSKTTGSKSESESNVYSVGAYSTLYDGPLYVDGWLQYAWADNKLGLKNQGKDKYTSSNITASIETGYGISMLQDKSYYYIAEPNIQLAYVKNIMGAYTSKYDGLRVSGGNNDGLISRTGLRFYTKDKKTTNYTVEPYTEFNWFHSTNRSKLNFDGVTYKDATPKNKYEVKIGLQSSYNKFIQTWGELGYQFGESNYNEIAASLGIRYLW